MSFPHAVNDADWIVGLADGAFLWTPEDGLLRLTDRMDVTGTGWTLREATSINAMGQIAGWGFFDPDNDPSTLNSERRGFLLTPVPEPSTMLLFAIAGTLVSRRRPRSC